MAEQFIRYGDKRIPMPADMTLEKAKEIMARHFPELADPKTERTTEDGATVYVFTKQMGRKGATGAARVAAGLARLKPIELVPPAAVELLAQAKFDNDAADAADIELPDWASVTEFRFSRNGNVERTRRALLALPPQIDHVEPIILL